MPFLEKRLVGPVSVPSNPTGLYTVPQSRTTIIKQVIVTNTVAFPATFSLYIGGTSSSNAVMRNTVVAGNDTIIVNMSQVMASGEVLFAEHDAIEDEVVGLTLTISGVENDGPIAPGSTYIADGAVTTAKIAEGAVVTADLANGAVTSAKTSFTDTNFAGTVTTDFLLVDGTNYPGILHAQMRVEPSLNNVGAGISMKATGAGSQSWSIISSGSGASQGAGSFLVYRDSSDGTSASLRIDSSGRVFKPYQPAFRHHGFTITGSGMQGGGAPLNVGNHLSIGSGGTFTRFTAPVTGLYVFGFSILINETGLRFEAIMRKNGSMTIDGYGYYAANDYSNATNAYSNAVNTYIVQLAANDYVDWYSALGTAFGANDRGDKQFWGYLLG
jgi:hypothetical protein